MIRWLGVAVVLILGGCLIVEQGAFARGQEPSEGTEVSSREVIKGGTQEVMPSCGTVAVPVEEEEWREKLTPEQYHILREKGTERAFTGVFYDHYEPGVYLCAGCDQLLFDSTTKFKSGSGWPSFWEATQEAIVTKEDHSFGMLRTEILCSRCEGHLGHVFHDGPEPTGLRYCVNSASLRFVSSKEGSQD